MLAGEYCSRDVVIVNKTDSVLKAAKLMRKHHVGNVLVVEPADGDPVPIGILTDRDLVIEVIANEVDINAVTIEDVMSFDLVTIKANDDLMAAVKQMRSHGIRRIPVVTEEGNLVGILAVDDIIDVITEQLVDIDQLISREQNKERKTRPFMI